MKCHRLYLLIATIVFSPTLFAAENLAENDLEVTVGFGAIQSPRYLGDDESESRLLPGIRVKKGERFEASVNNGVRYALLLNGPWRAGPILNYDFGRDEDASGDELDGLGDVDGTVELGVMLEYRSQHLRTGLDLRQGVSGGHEGLVGEAKLSYLGTFDAFERRGFYSLGPSFKFGDQEYLSTFFDVDAAQSARSGISEYESGGGLFSAGLRATAVLPVNSELGFGGFVSLDRLQGDVSESSIVKEEGESDQLSLGLFLDYRLR